MSLNEEPCQGSVTLTRLSYSTSANSTASSLHAQARAQ